MFCCRNYEIIKRFAFYSRGNKELQKKRWKKNVAINRISICSESYLSVSWKVCVVIIIKIITKASEDVEENSHDLFTLLFAGLGVISSLFRSLICFKYSLWKQPKHKTTKNTKSYMEICFKSYKTFVMGTGRLLFAVFQGIYYHLCSAWLEEKIRNKIFSCALKCNKI